MSNDANLDELWFGQVLYEGDEERQGKYIGMILFKIKELKKAYPESYVAELHDNIVAQLVRSNIMIMKYEMLIINHQHNKDTRKILKEERSHNSDILGKLMSHLKAVIKDKSKKDETVTSMFSLEEIS